VPALLAQIADGLKIRYPIKLGRTILGRATTCDILLPDDSVSRRHCVIERTADAVRIVDSSRNGTRVDGEVVERQELSHGAVIEIAGLRLRFVATDDRSAGSTTAAVRPRPHEELVEVDPDGVSAARAVLRAVRGPRAGQVFVLDRPVVRVGGAADHICLPDLPANALCLRVVRGRVIVEPNPGVRVKLAGSPVQLPTPAWLGEEIAVGPHGLVVEQQIRREQGELDRFGDLVGASPGMRRLFALLQRIAAHDHPALITGESGTGKELAARAVHAHGPRAQGPYIPLNCAALPEHLVESTLFGHEKGSFTGASGRQDGAFHAAHRGTIFLDEVGELRLETQAKLLRALESGEVTRVGSTTAESPDVRVVAATNRDLQAMVVAGEFRADLYFRLSVLRVRMPALRDRLQDLPLLVRSLLDRTLPDTRVDDGALQALKAHSWPGNVRELKNVLIRSRVMYGPRLTADKLMIDESQIDEATMFVEDRDDGPRETILSALAEAEGNRSRAAQILGVPRSSLLYRMKRYGIS